MAIDRYKMYLDDPDKGLNYLMGIIRNKDKVSKYQKDLERKKYGIAPPKINLKDDDE